MTKLLNRLSEELYELREFINDEDHRIKTLEYEKSKLDIKKNRLFNKSVVRKEKLTDEEVKLDSEISKICFDKFYGDNLRKLEFEKKRLEALKKYLKEQEENSFKNIYIKQINTKQTFKSVECVICLTNTPNVLFCNCGHLCLCTECDKVKSLNTCPVCKTETTIKRDIEY